MIENKTLIILIDLWAIGGLVVIGYQIYNYSKRVKNNTWPKEITWKQAISFISAELLSWVTIILLVIHAARKRSK